MKTFSSILGDTCVYDDLRGNFSEARQWAESAARQNPDAPGAWLDLGVTLLLQGNCIQARESFFNAQRLAADDPSSLMIALCWLSFTDKYQFEFNPDGSQMAGVSLDLSARYPYQNWLKYHNEIDALKTQAQANAQQDAMLIYRYLPTLFLMRSAATTGNLFLDPSNRFLEHARQHNMLHQFAMGLRHRADLLRRAGDLPEAQKALDEAEMIYRNHHDVFGQGLCFLQKIDWQLAPVSSPMALNAYLGEGEPTALFPEFGRRQIDLPQLKDLFQLTEEAFAQAGQKRAFASLFLRAGYSYWLQENFQAALEMTAAAKTLFDESGDQIGAHLALAHRVVYLTGAGNWGEINDLPAQIGKWGKESGSHSYALGLGILFNRIGIFWLQKRSDPQQALRLFQASEALFKSLDASAAVAGSLEFQGDVFKVLQDKAAAFHAYDMAMNILHELPEAYRIEEMQEPVSTRIFTLGNKINTFKTLEKPSAPTAPTTSGEMLRGAFSDIGNLDWLNQRFEIAIEQWENGNDEVAMNQFRQLLNDATEAKAWLIVAAVHGRLREYDLAVEAFEKDLAANLLQESPMSFFKNAFEQFTQQQAANPEAQEFTQLFLSNLESLPAHLQQQLNSVQTLRTWTLSLAFFTRCKAWQRAQEFYEKLLAAGGEHWHENLEEGWTVLQSAGALFEGLGDFKNALSHYNKAISAFNQLRSSIGADEWKTSLINHPDAPYLYFSPARCALLWAKNQTGAASQQLQELAFEYVEKGKGQALNDLLKTSLSLSHDTGNLALDAWQQASAQAAAIKTRYFEAYKKGATSQELSSLRQQVETTAEELANAERNLHRSLPGFYEILRQEAPAATVSTIAGLLPEGTLLLQFMQLSDHLLGFALTNKGLVKTLLTETEVRTLNIKTRRLHFACAEKEGWQALAEELANVFLTPFAGEIAKAKHLLISPFGEANKLPFHVLPFQGQPLALSKTISYLPNAGLLEFLSKPTVQSAAKNSLLAIGNPANMVWSDPLTGEKHAPNPLPGSELEARYVATLFPQGTALTGAAATEPAVRELVGNTDLLLLATHGIVSPGAPLESCILLANGGELTVAELMGLQLQARLVVMSACETALGRHTSGNEVIGLTRGLLAAGAKAAIVSLWPVDDQATCVLMGEFYRRLKTGETPCQALQSAQRFLFSLRKNDLDKEVAALDFDGNQVEIQKDSRRSLRGIASLPQAKQELESKSEFCNHPYWWAAFVLVGNPF